MNVKGDTGAGRGDAATQDRQWDQKVPVSDHLGSQMKATQRPRKVGQRSCKGGQGLHPKKTYDITSKSMERQKRQIELAI